MEFKKFVVSIHYMEAVEEKQVTANPMTIGRSYSVDLPLIFHDVSRTHVKVYCQAGELFIEDLGSKNGTFINGTQIEPNKLVPLKESDRVALGKTEETLSFRAECVEVAKPVPLVKPKSVTAEPPPVGQALPLLRAEQPVAPRAPVLQKPTSVPSIVNAAELQQLKDEKRAYIEEIQKLEGELHSLKENLKENRAQFQSEAEQRKVKISKLDSEIQELEALWKKKSEALLKEQAEIKKELQAELQEMKQQFDERRADLEKLKAVPPESPEAKGKKQSLADQIMQLQLLQDELTGQIEEQKKYLAGIESEAEDFFIARQNELLKEREQLEKLKAQRMLDVELEVAKFKAAKIREFEGHLKLSTMAPQAVSTDKAPAPEQEPALELETLNPGRWERKKVLRVGGMLGVAVAISLYGFMQPTILETAEMTSLENQATPDVSPPAPALAPSEASRPSVAGSEPAPPAAVEAPRPVAKDWKSELSRFVVEDLKLEAKTAEKYLALEQSWAEESKRLMQKQRNSKDGKYLKQLKARQPQVVAQMTQLLKGRQNYARLLEHREKFFREQSSK